MPDMFLRMVRHLDRFRGLTLEEGESDNKQGLMIHPTRYCDNSHANEMENWSLVRSGIDFGRQSNLALTLSSAPTPRGVGA